MNEKQAIEKATGEKFLSLYNSKFAANYKVEKVSDNPDLLCRDEKGNVLNIEITLTEDREGDIKALLGRSNHKSLEYVKQHGMGPVSKLDGNVLENLLNKIENKIHSDYGSNVALVIRDTSGVEWSWGTVLGTIRSRIDLSRNPFDRGVWILSGDSLFEVSEERKF